MANGHDRGRNWRRPAHRRSVAIAVAAGLLPPLLAIGMAAAPANAQPRDARPAGGLTALLEQRLGDLVARSGFSMAGHEAADGPRLTPNNAPHQVAQLGGQACPATAETKRYEIAAIRTRINLDRWGDHDPEGFMFAAVDDLPAIQASAATGESGFFGISLGLGDDVIQPLTLRVNVGDCLRVELTNLLDMPTSFHVHGSDLVIADTGAPALSTNPDSTLLPGQSQVYHWYVDPAHYEENTHYAHPHGPAARFQVSHGLFGAVIVEPPGSEYFNQRSAAPLCGRRDSAGVRQCRNSWDAMISPGEGEDFREFAMFYHEIGHENFVAINAGGGFTPLFDPISQTYKPAGRAINYRSEPFLRRINEAAAQVPFYADWHPDEALAYSSYAFGDPATPVPQSYLGDPVKFRLLHGGSEVFHVPHLHGGGVQWQRQPHVGMGDDDYVPMSGGLQKQFAASLPSSATDSQTIGPSETYDLEISCGSGGCQQSVGDFLFHCHIASHYIAGMWHFWRVYNTLQDEANKTDGLAVVAELPDRRGRVAAAVTSEGLIGQQVTFAGERRNVTQDSLADLVETQLPPPGQPRHVQDAQVMNWARTGDTYLNEPETVFSWPNFVSRVPRQRFPLLFSRQTGHLAWPFLRPHLGARPPFAPHHGPAPYLEPLHHQRHDPAPPGSNGAASLCPAEAPRRQFKIHAIQTPIDVAPGVTEPDGMLFVLKEHEDAARSDPAFKVPLAIRANQGDCVDVVMVNELVGINVPGRERPEILKTNVHIHFVQFDVQASDGVPTGAAFEQAPRAITDRNLVTPLLTDVPAGSNTISVSNPELFHPGAVIAIGVDQAAATFETATVAEIGPGGITLAQPLANAHRRGELATAEFVRYRWYVARQNGAIYFHDHVDALFRWGRGLFGALIAEPRDATFHDPQTGAEISSGPIADIHTDAEVVPGLTGSFREFVLFMADRNPQTGSTVNMRAEPLFAGSNSPFARRTRGSGAPGLMLASRRGGDPVTPLLQAYAGDPIMLRLLTTATEEIHPFVVTGHQFRQDRFDADAPLVNSVGIGVSERFNAYIASAGGPMRRPGDYLYYSGSAHHFERGVWGLLRVHGAPTEALRPLPGRPPVAPAGVAGNPCPAGAPVRRYAVGVIIVPAFVDSGSGARDVNARRFILESEGDGLNFLTANDPPLVLRANAGDCLEVRVTNRATGVAGFAIEGANFDPENGYGTTIGQNRERALEPGQSAVYRYYLPSELGILRIRDFANPFLNAELGLYGALIVEPPGSTWHDPLTGDEVAGGVDAVVRTPDGEEFREFVTMFADHDREIGMFLMPYDVAVDGDALVNFLTTPVAPRIERLGTRSAANQAHLFTGAVAGPPATPVFVAEAGERVRFRVLSAHSEQPQVFSVEGHDWQLQPGVAGADVVSSRLLISGGTLNVELREAGGPAHRPGDYLWLNHRMPFLEAGQWGILRIVPRSTERALGPRRDRILATRQ